MRIILTFILLLFCLYVYPHGDVHKQIVAVTKQIELDPDNPNLFFKRGALYHTHGDFDESFVDYLTALQLKPDFNLVNLRVGELCLKHSFYNTSVHYLNKYIDSIADNSRAYITRARSLRYLGKYAQSSEDYEKANDFAKTALPEQYYEWCEVILADSTHSVDDAIQCINIGQARIGDLISFREKKIEAYLQHKKYNKAIIEIDHLIKSQKRNELWHKKKANVYLIMGNKDLALKSYKDALNAIDKLPLSRKNTAKIIELEKELKESVRNIK